MQIAQEEGAMDTKVESSQFVAGWDIVQTLGEGAYGEVKLLVNQRSQQALALKIIDLSLADEEKEDAYKNVQKEKMIMAMLNHENIIKLYGSREDGTVNYLFLELADGGELFDKIEPDVGMETERAQFFFKQLIAGVEYLHRRGVAHRDLKPENLLVTSHDCLKISDFGLATVFRSRGRERLCKSRCGTLPYVAPEVLVRAYRGEPADLWSCGVILVALLAGELPWDSPSVSCPQFSQWKEKQNLDQSPWKKIEIVALSLIKTILQYNVDQRVTLQKIKTARWFVKDFRKQNRQLCRLNSGEAQQKKKKLKFEQTGGAEKETLSSTQPDILESVSRTPTPPDSEDFSATINNASFSQPIDLSSLLLGSQSQCTQSQTFNPLQRLVKRMTRFCVEVSLEETLHVITAACEACGCSVKTIPPAQMCITAVDRRKTKLSLKASVYPMPENHLLVDFRLSNGDGLEFKRMFQKVKGKVKNIISKDSIQWLQEKGLVTPLKMDNLSLK